jgi:hypothetical protein
MSVKIGKLLPDGCVRHIEIFHGGISGATASTLKNFYSTEKRIDMLLDLGNLYHIGSSLYGRCTDRNDYLHCNAAIRDKGENRRKNEAVTSENREIFVKSAEVCYLYENGKWSILVGKHSVSIDFSTVFNLIKRNPLSRLEIYEFKNDGSFSKISDAFSNWDEILSHAATENKSLYIFRENRLVKTINHPLQKNKTV